MELLFDEQISGAFEPFVDEIDLAVIALSCHFALDVLCYKEGVHDSAGRFIGHHCPWSCPQCWWRIQLPGCQSLGFSKSCFGVTSCHQ